MYDEVSFCVSLCYNSLERTHALREQPWEWQREWRFPMQIQFSTCEWGCGGFLKPGNRFLNGHTSGRPAIIRFWEKVNKTADCWTWQGGRRGQGYGVFWIHGAYKPVHRFSWELHYGPIPEAMLVCHHCDNPSCVRPDHLFLGTPQDNMDDMWNKERGNPPQGERSGFARITQSTARQILALAGSGLTRKAVANQFKVDPSLVSRIWARRIWKGL